MANAERTAPIPILAAYQSDALTLLDEAKELGFTEVLIIGLRDGDVWVKHSAGLSRVRQIGYLELAKQEVIATMGDS